MQSRKILLVDNGNDGLNDYYALLSDYTLDTIMWDKLDTIDPNHYDLILLTHGRGISVKKNLLEKELLLNTNVPVIGICYGFQMIAVTYGLEIVPLKTPSYGENTINVLSDHIMFDSKNKFISVEKHKYGVIEMNDNPLLKLHGDSCYGVEIIEVMGKRQFGFQFHPEISTSNNEGRKIFFNLLNYIFSNPDSNI